MAGVPGVCTGAGRSGTRTGWCSTWTPDPGAGLAECVEVAFLVKERLGALGELIVPVTCGSKGMHLYVPLPDPITSEDASVWARQVAEEMQKALPRLVVWR